MSIANHNNSKLKTNNEENNDEDNNEANKIPTPNPNNPELKTNDEDNNETNKITITIAFNLLFKTKYGRKIILSIFLLQFVSSFLILLLQIMNAKYKFASALNFNPLTTNIVHKLIIPHMSYQDTGEFLFKIFIGSIFSILISQIIRSLIFTFKSKISQTKKEEKGNNNALIFGLSLSTLILTDIIREFFGQIDNNIQKIIASGQATVAIFIFINFLKFAVGSLRTFLKLLDFKVKDGKILDILGNSNKQNEKDNKVTLKNPATEDIKKYKNSLTVKETFKLKAIKFFSFYIYLWRLCLTILIPSVALLGFHIYILNFLIEF